jgi:hypothetical protein
MNINFKSIPTLLQPVLQKVREYGSFVLILTVLASFGFIIIRIRFYANQQPSQAAIDEKLLDLKRSQINQAAIDKIERLQHTNVDVKTLFDQARDNPFHE